MMIALDLFDIPPAPSGIGLVVAVVIFVIAFVGLLASALVMFLWLRKRSLRRTEMVQRVPLTQPQPNNPNQP